MKYSLIFSWYNQIIISYGTLPVKADNLKGGVMAKKLELWEGYEVEFNEELADDFDFVSDLATAEKNGDFAELISMYFALVGGEKVFEDTRKHITKEKGRFSSKALAEVLTKISEAFPKVGNRAQKRTWQTSK